VNHLILKVTGIAVIVGLVCGALVVLLIYLQRRRQIVDSLVRSDNVIGRLGTVEIPFNHSSPGKVRVEVKGSLVEFVAFVDQKQEFSRGDRVVVVAMKGNKVWVVAENSLSQ
jgi:membrane protein implicated in regulation of membrane protease activity